MPNNVSRAGLGTMPSHLSGTILTGLSIFPTCLKRKDVSDRKDPQTALSRQPSKSSRTWSVAARKGSPKPPAPRPHKISTASGGTPKQGNPERLGKRECPANGRKSAAKPFLPVLTPQTLCRHSTFAQLHQQRADPESNPREVKAFLKQEP